MLAVDFKREYPLGAIILNAFWAVVLGYFALRFDKDPEECMASDETDAKFHQGDQDSAFVDVGADFRYFFEIACFGHVAQVALGVLTQLPLQREIRHLAFLLIALLGYAIFMAWIWGFYCRMSHEGRVCSGDFLDDGASEEGYLIEQGMFIKWATIVLLALATAAMGLVLFGVLAAKPRHN